MTETHGVATRVLYQLFIALGKKQKAGLTGVAMETMRPAAPAKLDRMKTLMYKEVCPPLIVCESGHSQSHVVGIRSS